MDWKIAYEHQDKCKNGSYTTIEELEKSGFDIIPASVPGNFELDLMKAGRIDDLYYSVNTLEAQKLEDVHVWYYTAVNITNPAQYLRFEGIDTIADIYVNGKLVKSTDNMFLAYDVDTEWKMGENEVVVHIKPIMLASRDYTPPVASNAHKYGHASLYVRKAAHSFGWDIMPRILTSGLWKEVKILEHKEDQINEVYFVTNRIWDKEDGSTGAQIRFYINADLKGSYAQDYSVRIEGSCGESHFVTEERLWHNTHSFSFDLDDCKLWWPKHAGEPNLYDITVSLLYKGEVCDTYQLKTGFRTAELDRTDVTDIDGNGEFCFKINGKKIFVLGSNWVPLDAFHANDGNRLAKAMEMVDDIGCNMLRCWGGNLYESDEFFDFCDAHGIMIWQDFAMGCAVYPDEDAFAAKLYEDAVFQIKRLRNHTSLTLWAGDNECDMAHMWGGFRRNPNQNSLTRKVLKRAVELHDYSRPYLPSSPYISEEAYAQEAYVQAVYRGKGVMPENHLWGPRDYFKGAYYRDSFCHFASETGYHGFPSTKSLKGFLKEPEKIFNENGIATDEYLVHAASMELIPDAPYAYRIRLAHNQVVTLFGKAEEKLEDFVKQSQISQAEAKKYFIEKFRIGKWKRTGIIWWNLLDGWPQVSDAIVDYYYVKKLAYHYIKRSQEPVCLMFDEPENGSIRLVGVNDLPEARTFTYTVKRIRPDEDAKVVMSGNAVLSGDSSATVAYLPVAENEKEFYLIEWEMDGVSYKNHYFTNIIDIDYRKYLNALEQCGMDEFEGFDD